MDLSRIANTMDTSRTRASHVAIVGGFVQGARDFARCGVQTFTLIDFDTVDSSNIARQEFLNGDVHRPKVEAIARSLRAINPDVQCHSLARNFLSIQDDEAQSLFRTVDLFVYAPDSFAARARGNEIALLLQKPALWVGVYPRGQAGEIILFDPAIHDSCYRCLVPGRYAVHAEAEKAGREPAVSSTDVTIMDINFLDAIAVQVGIGLLTRGANNRFGRLIAQLGDRQMLQVKIDPAWNLRGHDVVREQLGIPEERDTYFAWNTIARRDPDRGQLYCPDCARFRGHRFESRPEGSVRIKPSDQEQCEVSASDDAIAI